MSLYSNYQFQGVAAITGAQGFVGRALAKEMRKRGRSIRLITRNKAGPLETEVVSLHNIGADTDWRCALDNVECVIHCAARVHVPQDTAADTLAAYREVNVAGARRLADQAAALGVRRLVFVSSVKVNGEHTPLGRAFSENDTPTPLDAYGISKWEAEQALWEVARCTGLEVVVVRPPLVYGPGVKGNFARLIYGVRRGVPFPFGSVKNCRSLVGVDNLVDMLIYCTQHPRAAGRTFLVSDGEDLSTPVLIRRLAHAANRPVRLIPFPIGVMRAGARLLGRTAELERLVGSLQVDIGHTCRTLDWAPPVTVDKGLARAIMG